ncbi:MAG: hypothetical protein ACI392_08595 [Paludibacteraceae bacterium]
MKKLVVLICLTLCANGLVAQHIVEVGAGWGDMGMTRTVPWKPFPWSQGSRKEAQSLMTYKYMLGSQRVYYVPSIRLQYDNTWSMSGGMNLMNINVGVAGLGIYLTQPMAAFVDHGYVGRWFATFEINFASIAVGGNITPNLGVRGSNSGHRLWITPDRQFGGQYYPIKETYEPNDGRYLFLHYSLPIEFRVWKMVTETVGVGFFLASDIAIIEKDFTHPDAPVAMGYNIYGGLAITLYK